MNKRINLKSTMVVICIACFCDLLWGSAFPCIKLGYNFFNISGNDEASQILFAGLRFMIAGFMVVLGYSIIKGRMIIPKSADTVKRICTLSLFQMILQYLLFYLGLAKTTGVKGSIIEGANVFVALIVTCLIFRLEQFTARKLIGSIVGFAGIIIINLSGLQLDINVGDLLILISTCAYAISSVLLKYYAPKEDTVLLSGYQFLFGGFILFGVGAICGGRLQSVNIKGILMLLYLAFISAMAYSLWAVLLANNPVSKVSVMGFLNPVFGVVLSAIILNEGKSQLGLKSILALVLVCIGIYIVYHTPKECDQATSRRDVGKYHTPKECDQATSRRDVGKYHTPKECDQAKIKNK